MNEIVTPGPAQGYQGIWYALGKKFEHGDKYSGGLGTYTANHVPMAVYAPKANKTFFTYGGCADPNGRQLVIMISYYDHVTGLVPRPLALHLDAGVDDPHDNASLQIDAAGYIWVFKSGRAKKRPGVIYRSCRPYEIGQFERVLEGEITYPQPWYDARDGFTLLFTKYAWPVPGCAPQRELFWKTGGDGAGWGEDSKLAGFGGHYQVSNYRDGKLATFFNWHPEGDVDRRTNIYYVQSLDRGRTWTTASGEPLELPLDSPSNAALVEDLQTQGLYMYTCDLNFDRTGNPVLLMIVSRAGEPGPKGDPRQWTILHWKEGRWVKKAIAVSDHNYDMGSLYIEDKEWRVIGPTEPGPQRYGAGGEMALWISRDEGCNWLKASQITGKSEFNHSYARRPLGASDPFYVFWADGHPADFGPSRLYFGDSKGEAWRLPYVMKHDFAAPEPVPHFAEVASSALF